MNHTETRLNKKIGSVRIICENFYGRMKNLWGASRLKFRGDLSGYDDLNDICVALTNYHIELHPLRKNDGAFYINSAARRKTPSNIQENKNTTNLF